MTEERKVGKRPAFGMPYGAEGQTFATLTENPETPGKYRVEAEDGDEKQIAIFSGLGALDCAIFFAGNYYDGWNDPQGLAGY